MARGSKSKLPTILIVLGVLGYLAYDRLTGPGGHSSVPAVSTPVRQSAPVLPGYALNPANSWPPEAGDGDVQGLAPDLFGVNYYVVLDGSGSMSKGECADGRAKIHAARDALFAFARSVPGRANLGLAVFDGRGLSERLPLGRDNRESFVRAAAQVRVGGETPLRRAVELAYARLLEQGGRQLGYGEYHLVIVTDGLASGGEDPTAAVDRVLAESPVVFHTIGFCIGKKHPLNQPGRTYYRSANNPKALQQGLETVLAEAPDFSLSRFGD